MKSFPRRSLANRRTQPSVELWKWLLQWSVGIVVAGLAAGIAALTFVFLLHTVEHLLYGYGELGELVGRNSRWRRVLVPTLGGFTVGCGWWLLRRSGPIPTGATLLNSDDASVHLGISGTIRSWLDAALQVLVVGAGGSIGREGAPRQSAATLTALVLNRFPFLTTAPHPGRPLTPPDITERGTTHPINNTDASCGPASPHHPVSPDRRAVLIASAAGAGLAAVYTTPLAGAVFAMEVALRQRSLRGVRSVALPALAISCLAVLVAYPQTHDLTTYSRPTTNPTAADAACAVVALLLAVPAALLFRRALSQATACERPVGPQLVVALTTAGALLGCASCAAPPLVGNGTALIADVLQGPPSALMLLLFVLAKPLFTWMYVRAGAQGGLLTPALCTGAALGALVAAATHTVGGAQHPAVIAMCTAAAFLAITQDAPCFAAAFVWELTALPVLALPLLLILALGAHRISQGFRWKPVAPKATDRPS